LLIGDTVHVVTSVIDLQVSSRRHGRVTWLRQLVNQTGQVVQKGIFETLVSTSQVRTRRDPSGRVNEESLPRPHTVALDTAAKMEN